MIFLIGVIMSFMCLVVVSGPWCTLFTHQHGGGVPCPPTRTRCLPTGLPLHWAGATPLACQLGGAHVLVGGLRSLLEGVDLALATVFADPCTGGALVWARLACAQLRLRYIEGTEGRRGAVPLLPCGLAPKWACIA